MFLSDLKILLGFMPSVRMAECTQCQGCSSPQQRQCPFCNASFPENCVIRKFTALDIPEDMVEVFITCPGCGRSLKPETEKCPECSAVIEREYRSQSIEANVTISQASINAEKIETANPGVVIVIMVSVAVTACAIFFDQPHVAWFLLLPLIMSTITLLKIRQWFRWFASYQFDHEDFVTARGKVKHAYRSWLAALAAQIGLAVVLLGWLSFRN